MSEVELIHCLKGSLRELLSSLDVIDVNTHVRVENQVVDLLVKTKDNDVYLIEAMSSSEPSRIHAGISRLRSYQTSSEESLIIATPKMSEKGKILCKQAGVGYLDLQGNVYIKYKKILIDRVQEREIPGEFKPRKRRVKRPLTETSFHVLIYMLINRERSITQQELSVNLRVSKGYINRILKTFEEGIKFYGEVILFQDADKPITTLMNAPNLHIIGEVTTTNKSSSEILKPSSGKKPHKYYRLTNPGKIIEILSKEHDFNDNEIHGYYSFERKPGSIIKEIARVGKLMNLPHALTQHAGASQVAPHVRFNDVYLYVREKDIQNWITNLDLKETELGGNVKLVIPRYEWYFSETQAVNGCIVIKDELLYLDLINYPRRGKEQAEFLRDQRLGF